MSGTIRLLIADDEHLIRGALEALLNLEPDIDVVASAADGEEAIALALETKPDVCLLDLEMPKADGLAAAAKILAEVPTRAVIVTRHARPGVLRRALSSKVSGFVPKSMAAEELADVIRAVAEGKRYIDSDIAATALSAERCPLTDRELDAVRLSRSTLSVQQISEELHLAPGTVRNYLSSAMAKLGVSSRHQAAEKAWEQGWI
ncbi:response regulator transcription factor [Humidisolicoccus flavus]|uniref:response regulator transcription factor n=1 Tax=Humidisolicoccus flavus TaxID=3111414 RepID=UPI003244B450